jgi:hypothetical protein
MNKVKLKNHIIFNNKVFNFIGPAYFIYIFAKLKQIRKVRRFVNETDVHNGMHFLIQDKYINISFRLLIDKCVISVVELSVLSV